MNPTNSRKSSAFPSAQFHIPHCHTGLFFFNTYLTCLHWVLVVAQTIFFSYSMITLSCGMWELSFPTRD